MRKKPTDIDKQHVTAQHCAHMQEAVVVEVVTPPTTSGTPPAGFASWCDWARDGLAKAMEGMKQAGGGVLKYNIGSRGLERASSKAQVDNVAYWDGMVKYYCGGGGLPTSLTGRDTACRIINRDI